MIQLSNEVRMRLPVRAVFFFAAPHKGLNIDALRSMVDGEPTKQLIDELERGSSTLDQLSEDFMRTMSKTLNIHSYYECLRTRTVIRVRPQHIYLAFSSLKLTRIPDVGRKLRAKGTHGIHGRERLSDLDDTE
jgi:hypothetical protein